MIQALLLLLPQPAPAAAFTPAPWFAQDDDPKAKYEEMRAEAGKDVAKLWEVHKYCEAYGLEREQKSILRLIVKYDEDDEKARELLGYIFYDGQWFTTAKKLEAYKKAEEKRKMEEEGLVRFGDEWVDPEDLPNLERGLVKTEDGRWVDPEEMRRLEEGWKQQDLVWISPDEFEKMDAGLWKCGDDWLSLEEANKYHSKIGQWWQIPMDHFVAYSTAPRETTEKALLEMEHCYRDLSRIFGKAPADKRLVILLDSQEQYNTFAGGNVEGYPSPEFSGYSGIHNAFFCESWFDLKEGVWPAAAATFWDSSSDAGNSWGRLAVRHAAAQTFAEFIDPSPKAIKAYMANPNVNFPSENFWGEKNLPLWFRYGAAAYCERYFIDSFAADTTWARNWSVGNIQNQGGLDSFDKIFEFAIGAGNAESGKLINQSGLMMAFILDGKCTPVVQQHAAVKNAIKTDGNVRKEIEKLEQLIAKHEAELRLFAGL